MTQDNTTDVGLTPKEKSSAARITIRVEENGDFSIDGNKKEIEALKPELLEKIVDASLEGRVDYEINGEAPIASFFQTLMQGTNAESELRKVFLAANEDTDLEEDAIEAHAEDEFDPEE